jgi:hypothetical protein
VKPAIEIEKPLPQNLEAERSVLGAILLDNANLPIAAARLRPHDFFSAQHLLIFAAILAMGESQRPIDTVTLYDELERRTELEAAGGAAYVASLIDGVPQVTHIEHHAQIVSTAAKRRRLIYAADSLRQLAFAGDDTDLAVQHITSLAAESARATVEIFDTIQEFESAPPATFSITDFLQDYAVTAIAGLSENGKTWVSLNIAAALLFGPGRLWDLFDVTGRAEKVVYLIPESSRATFKTRLQRMGLYDEIGKRLFVRTLTKGPTIPLADPAILREVKGAHVFCDTAIRFMRADENNAVEAQGLSDDFFALQRAEARSVVALFHSPKSFAGDTVMTLENMIRGSSEFGAAIAGGWGIRQIDRDLNIIHVSNIKARDFARCGDFQLIGRPHIDESGGFVVHRRPENCGQLGEYIERRSRGGAPGEAQDTRKENIALVRSWLAEAPNLTNEELYQRFKSSGIEIADATARKYKAEAKR